MTVHRPMVVVALLFACALIVASCGSSGATVATESTESTAPGLYPVSLDGRWGYIDGTGTIVIEPQFDLALDFTEGLAAVTLEGKWGYIDTSGTMLIQPQFDRAQPFSEGLGAVHTYSYSDGQPLNYWGFVDRTGDVVIPMEYGLFNCAFSEGRCPVMLGDGGTMPPWGYIDKTGTVVIGPQFDTAQNFSEGLAAVSGGDNTSPHGFIDANGDWVIELPPDLMLGRMSSGFSEGLAIVHGLPSFESDVNPVIPEGYIDKTGAVVIQPQFECATDFSEGLAAVRVAENGALKWGFIDTTGAIVIQPKYDQAGLFTEGLAAVGTLPTDRRGDGVFIGDCRWGYIDKTGTVIIELQDNQVAYPFCGGMARVETWTEKSGAPISIAYIDSAGMVIWERDY